MEDTIDVQLDRSARLHNGLKYRDFCARIDLKVSIQQIATDFGVSRQTIYDWISKHKRLQGTVHEKNNTNSNQDDPTNSSRGIVRN
jgi:transposase-like protein